MSPLTLTNRAWSRLYRITCAIQTNKFILGIGGNRYQHLFYKLLPFNEPEFKHFNLTQIDDLIKEENTTNGVTNTVFVHPTVQNLITSVNIDYQRSNYENHWFENKFIFDVDYADPISEATEKVTLNTNKQICKPDYDLNDNINFNVSTQEFSASILKPDFKKDTEMSHKVYEYLVEKGIHKENGYTSV